MKLIYYPYDFQCEFFCDKLNRIVIEHKEVFEKFIVNLDKSLHKDDSFFYMEENDKEINMEKHMALVSSPLDLTYMKKDIQKALYNRLAEEIHINDLQEKLIEYYANILEEMDLLKIKTGYHFEYNELMDYQNIFKMLNIELKQPTGNFVEKLLDYMSVEMELMQKSVFVIANCGTFLEEKCYNELVKWSQYQNVIIIFVENKQEHFDGSINEYIWDKDLCVIGGVV